MAMFEQGGENRQKEVFALKCELLNLRGLIAPERDVLNTLIRRDEPILLDVQLSMVSNPLNWEMKRMTALSTILMSVNLVASNYGKNFHYMPELDRPRGYAWALGLMLTVGVFLALLFRRIDWL